MIALPMNPYTSGGVAESQINVKMPAALKARLVAMEKATRIPKTELLRALGEAACEFYEENGFFGFPIRISSGNPTPPKKLADADAEFQRTLYKEDKERIGRAMSAERRVKKAS